MSISRAKGLMKLNAVGNFMNCIVGNSIIKYTILTPVIFSWNLQVKSLKYTMTLASG